jgi:exodeoxyribonuclease-1
VLAALRSPRIQVLGARILTRNWGLPATREFRNHLEKLAAGGNITGYRSEERFTLPQAVASLNKITENQALLDIRQQHALTAIAKYLRGWAALQDF